MPIPILDVFTEILEVCDEQSPEFTKVMDFFRSAIGSRPEFKPGLYYTILDLSCTNDAAMIQDATNHEEALEIALSHVDLHPGDEGQVMLIGMCPCEICGSAGKPKGIRIRIAPCSLESTNPGAA